MLWQAKYSHKRFNEIWYPLLKSFSHNNIPRYKPKEISTSNMTVFFFNYWLTKPRIMLNFAEFMRTVHEQLSNLEGIQDALWSDSGYEIKNIPLAQAIFKKDYYTFHPFILKRISPFYFNTKNYSINVHRKLDPMLHELK